MQYRRRSWSNESAAAPHVSITWKPLRVDLDLDLGGGGGSLEKQKKNGDVFDNIFF